MKILKYTPEAARDLEYIKEVVTEEFGENAAMKTMKRIRGGIRTLEIAENAGVDFYQKYGIISDYRIFFVAKNYVIYRVEGIMSELFVSLMKDRILFSCCLG